MSEGIGQLATALAKAQAEMKHAAKDANNPFFHSKYADLAGVWDACRPALAKYGLSVVQTTRVAFTGDNTAINVLKTTLLHESGESIEGEVVLRPMRQEKNVGWVVSEDPQSIGSAMTYARRYALAAITGVATEDDDGNDATGNKTGPKPAPSIPKQLPADPPPPAPVTGVVNADTAPVTPVVEVMKVPATDDEHLSVLSKLLQDVVDNGLYESAGAALYEATTYTTKDGKKAGYKDPFKLKAWQMSKASTFLQAKMDAMRQPGEDAPEEDIKW